MNNKIKIFVILVLLITTLSCESIIRTTVYQDTEYSCTSKDEYPRISKEIKELSENDAVSLAINYLKNNEQTKSGNNRIITDIIPIYNKDGILSMYAINFNEGYILISATKDYFPIIAEIDSGTYQIEDNDYNTNVFICQTLDNIRTSKVNSIYWMPYEELKTIEIPKTKVEDDYYNLVDVLREEWYEDEKNVYYLRNKPDNMPEDLYEYFCERAREDMAEVDEYPYMDCAIITEKYIDDLYILGPLLTTHWNQNYPYNSSDPNGDALGCVIIAIGQIMKYHEYPEDSTFLWDIMPNDTSNSALSDFLYMLKRKVNGGELIDAERALKSFGFNVDYKWHNKEYVKNSIKEMNPVYMRGADKTTGKGHAWVCDGYKLKTPMLLYELYLVNFENSRPVSIDKFYSETIMENPSFTQEYYHMNWGWGGKNDGYYLDHNPTVTVSGSTYVLSYERQDLIVYKP